MKNYWEYLLNFFHIRNKWYGYEQEIKKTTRTESWVLTHIWCKEDTRAKASKVRILLLYSVDITAGKALVTALKTIPPKRQIHTWRYTRNNGEIAPMLKQCHRLRLGWVEVSLVVIASAMGIISLFERLSSVLPFLSSFCLFTCPSQVFENLTCFSKWRCSYEIKL